MRDWFLEIEEPCLLALEMEVALDKEAVSWFIVATVRLGVGIIRIVLRDVTLHSEPEILLR